MDTPTNNTPDHKDFTGMRDMEFLKRHVGPRSRLSFTITAQVTRNIDFWHNTLPPNTPTAVY